MLYPCSCLKCMTSGENYKTLIGMVGFSSNYWYQEKPPPPQQPPIKGAYQHSLYEGI